MKFNFIRRVSLLLVACTLLIGGRVVAQSFTQATADVRFVEGNAVFNTTVFTSKDVGKNWGISYFGLVTEGWAEAYAGPYWKVNKKLTLGVSVGIETPSPYIRTAASATWFSDKHAILLFLEKGSGEGNYWYSLSYEFTHKKVGYGAIAKRFYGVGPSISFPIKSIKLTLAPMYDIEAQVAKPTIFLAHVF